MRPSSPRYETVRWADSIGMMTCTNCIASDRNRSIGGQHPPRPSAIVSRPSDWIQSTSSSAFSLSLSRSNTQKWREEKIDEIANWWIDWLISVVLFLLVNNLVKHGRGHVREKPIQIERERGRVMSCCFLPLILVLSPQIVHVFDLHWNFSIIALISL